MYLPKNYQYTSHVAGERYSMWNWSDGASLVDINYRCLTNTHWSGQRHLRHSHSANKSAGALIETPVSILQIAAIGSCVRDLVPLPYLGNQYTAECTGRTVHPDWKNIYNVWRLWKPSGHFLLIFFLIVCLCLEKMLDLKFSHLWWLII